MSRTPDRAGFAPLSVDLLPRSAVAARRARRARRGAAFSAAGALAASLGLGVWSHADLGEARAGLEAVRGEGEVLVAERARFVELSTLDSDLARMRAIEEVAMERDVDWAPLVQQAVDALDAAAAAAGSTASTDTVDVAAISSEAELMGDGDVLGVPGIAQIQMSVRTSLLPDVGLWTSTLNAIHGLSDARITVASLDDHDGVPLYTSSVSITVIPEARSCRWSDADPAALEEQAAPDEASGEASRDEQEVCGG